MKPFRNCGEVFIKYVSYFDGVINQFIFVIKRYTHKYFLRASHKSIVIHPGNPGIIFIFREYIFLMRVFRFHQRFMVQLFRLLVFSSSSVFQFSIFLSSPFLHFKVCNLPLYHVFDVLPIFDSKLLFFVLFKQDEIQSLIKVHNSLIPWFKLGSFTIFSTLAIFSSEENLWDSLPFRTLCILRKV